MNIWKHILTLMGLCAIIVPLLPETTKFKISSKKVTIASGLLAIVSLLGIWLIDATNKTPITEASGFVFIQIKWTDNGNPSYSYGFEPSSIIKIYSEGIERLKLTSTKTETIGKGDGSLYYRNEYSTTGRGSLINSKAEDINKIDSLIVSDADFPNESDVVQVQLKMKINGTEYKFVSNDQSIRNKKLNLGVLKLENQSQ